jgi:hypothetical protein
MFGKLQLLRARYLQRTQAEGFLRKLLMWSLNISYIYWQCVLLSSCACHSCSSTACLPFCRKVLMPCADSYNAHPVNASSTWLTRSFGGFAKRELHKTSLRLWMDTYGNFHVYSNPAHCMSNAGSNIYVQYEICWSWMWWLGGSFGLTLTHLNPSGK